MNNYFFRPDFYASRYNCSLYTVEEWAQFGTKRPVLGILFICNGIICDIIYVPFLLSMIMQKKFRDMSCYKIMFTLGVFDLGNILIGAFASGYLTMVGGWFCTHPTITYFGGLIGVCSWCSACCTCILLAFNRIVDFTRPDLSDDLFAGYKTWLWMLIPVGYSAWIWCFEMPVIFDSTFVTWFYDPFKSAPVHYDFKYENTTHAINNVAVIFILVSQNAFLTYTIFKHSGQMSSSQRRKRQFIIQTLIICFLVVVAALVYVYMNYFYIPPILTILGTVAYQLNSGSPAIIYLVLNKSLRDASFSFFSDKWYKITGRGTVTHGSAAARRATAATESSVGAEKSPVI